MKGVATNAKLGLALRPPDAIMGVFIDGMASGMAGSRSGEAVYEGSKAIAKTAAKVVKGAMETVKSVAIRPLDHN